MIAYKQIRLLITGVGHPVAKATLESLQKISRHPLYIIGVDIEERGADFDWIDKHYFIPLPDSRQFIDKIQEICLRENIHLVIPWSDEEVEAIARHSELFSKNGTAVLCSPYKTIQRTIDKGIMLQELKKTNIPVPDFKLVESPEEIEHAAFDLGYPSNPLVVKPRRSSCGKGLWYLNHEVNLKQFFPAQRLTLDAFISLLNTARDNGQKIPDYVLMQYLPGDDYSVDALAYSGAPLFIVPRRRLQAVEGVSRISEILCNEKVKDMVTQVIREFSLHLNINVQMRYSDIKGGQPIVYEVNPRISGSIVINDAAGINLLYWGILLALGENIPSSDAIKAQQTRIERYWTESCIYSDEWFNP